MTAKVAKKKRLNRQDAEDAKKKSEDHAGDGRPVVSRAIASAPSAQASVALSEGTRRSSSPPRARRAG